MADSENPSRPITLFYSYSHRDERFREKIENQLKILQRRGVISEWHDRKIGAGKDWAKEIDTHLETAGIILLLVSDHFLASEYCWGKEMTRALERYDANEARVIPVILQPCLWQEAPFAKLQVVPRDGKPITKWQNRADAYLGVAEAIRNAVRELQSAAAAQTVVTATTSVPTPVAAATVKEENAAGKPAATPVVAKGAAAGIVHVGVDPRTLPDLAVFKDLDAPWCPEMVVIPKGSFLMGSPDSDPDAQPSEKPQHWVEIGYRFALGRYAVTFDEYDHFCAATGRDAPGDQGWGRGRRPVINVSWSDAQDYVRWLSKETGQSYRLPSEAEWEYAARAGTTTPFSFGAKIGPKQVNFDGTYDDASGGRGRYRRETVAVGSLSANSWGLHEMHGNVWEWCEDVWHGSYEGAPVDGSAWTGSAGAARVGRGGSWIDYARYVRSAYRNRGAPDVRHVDLGFRCARVQES